jgi:peptide deformylase
MSRLKIVHYPEPVLLTAGKPVLEEEFNEDLAKLVEDMFETMAEAGGVGLAAPQVAVSKRLFVMNVPGDNGNPQRAAFINPEIVRVEGEQIGDEGCLSFPGLYQVVKREMRVIARAQDVGGEKFEFDATDLAARCILHETDHCDGIVFLDRMTVLKREMAKRKIKRLQKTGEWEKYAY